MTYKDKGNKKPGGSAGKGKKNKRSVDELVDIFAERLFEILMMQIEHERKLEKDREKDPPEDQN